MKIFPENISTYGQEIDDLFYFIFVFVAIAFVISIFVLLYPLFKNRASKVQKAEYITGESKKHWNWVVAALVLLAVSDFTILLAEHHAWESIEREPPKADVSVVVTGRQWNWIFTYPGPDGKLNTSDDVVVDALNSELHVPVNKNIEVELKATDVLHSFFVPNARLKQDVIPGRTGKKWFNITKVGKYDIACAEICGIMHAKMRNFLVVETQEQYDQYIKDLYAKNAK